MSSANVIGADWGGFPANAMSLARGSASVPNGASPSSPAISVAFLTANDYIRLSWIAGSTVVGPITTPITNAGLVNASFTITSAGAVTAVGGSAGATYQWEVVKANA